MTTTLDGIDFERCERDINREISPDEKMHGGLAPGQDALAYYFEAGRSGARVHRRFSPSGPQAGFRSPTYYTSTCPVVMGESCDISGLVTERGSRHFNVIVTRFLSSTTPGRASTRGRPPQDPDHPRGVQPDLGGLAPHPSGCPTLAGILGSLPRCLESDWPLGLHDARSGALPQHPQRFLGLWHHLAQEDCHPPRLRTDRIRVRTLPRNREYPK